MHVLHRVAVKRRRNERSARTKYDLRLSLRSRLGDKKMMLHVVNRRLEIDHCFDNTDYIYYKIANHSSQFHLVYHLSVAVPRMSN